MSEPTDHGEQPFAGPPDLPEGSAGPGVPAELQQALGGEFEVVRRLGEGSWGTVYLARERALRRQVAVKVLNPGRAGDEESRHRFMREARAAASLSEHPNVVPVYRFGHLPDETPYLVMGYVRGRTLAERMQAEGRLPEEMVRTVLRDVAAALAAAHERGIVHRDVRPGNIFWDETLDRALLSDFGIAGLLAAWGADSLGGDTRLTQPGQLLRMADLSHLSPEQIRDEEASGQSDIYALGVTGYELLTGEGPYQVRNAADLINAHLSGRPRDVRELRDDVSEETADLLLRCLAREPRHRPTAVDLVRRLEGEATDATVEQRDADRARDVGDLIQRRIPGIVALTLGAGVALVGLMSELVERWNLPPYVFDLTVVFAVAALVASGVVGWFHGARGRQRAPLIEYVMLGTIGMAWLVVSVLMVVRGMGAEP